VPENSLRDKNKCVETNFVCWEKTRPLKKAAKKWRVNGGGVQKLENTIQTVKRSTGLSLGEACCLGGTYIIHTTFA
jgi:hypothetical protein